MRKLCFEITCGVVFYALLLYIGKDFTFGRIGDGVFGLVVFLPFFCVVDAVYDKLFKPQPTV